MFPIRKYAPEVTLLALAVLIAAVMAWIAPAAWATQPDPEHKVGICHRTASDTNPYVFIEVDEAAIPAHLENGHGHPAKTNEDGTPRDDYLADDASDCVTVKPTPTPTPTETEPTPTPTPTETKPEPTPTTTTPEPTPTESGSNTPDPKPTPDKPDKTPDEDRPSKTPPTLPKTGAALELLAVAGGAIALGSALYLLAARRRV